PDLLISCDTSGPGPAERDIVRFKQTVGSFAPPSPAPAVGPGALADRHRSSPATSRSLSLALSMATQDDVRQIALSLPATEEVPGRFAFAVRNKGKLKGFVSKPG